MKNYRVINHVEAKTFWIHEVFYDDDGNVDTFIPVGETPFGESLFKLSAHVQAIQEALNKPVLKLIGDKLK